MGVLKLFYYASAVILGGATGYLLHQIKPEELATVNYTQPPELWYVRKGTKVQGPYTVSEMHSLLLTRGVKEQNLVSQSGVHQWERLTQVPQLIPDELLSLEEPVPFVEGGHYDKRSNTNE